MSCTNINRTIVHLDLDTFYVSVERLKNSKLKGVPVIIGGTSDRGVVASCSYEAREFGVHSAMPMKLARRLCPQAILVKGDMDEYSKYSNIVTEIIEEKAPIVEKASIDEHYLDISGMDKFFGCHKWAHELRQRIINETGLPISFGLSANKTVSKVATNECKPNGERKIDAGTEKHFLAPLSIKKIPMIGDKTFTLLRNMGIERVETIQQMPVELMQKVIGDNGVTIWKKANGIDNSPVLPFAERKSISTESTFDKDTIDMVFLKQTLIGMVDQLGFQLRKEQKLTTCIVLKIRYSNFDTHTQQSRISYTSSDTAITQKVLELFAKLYNRRMLIRLIGVKCTNLVSGNHQISLFDDTVEKIQLYQAMDRIRKRYGADAICRAINI